MLAVIGRPIENLQLRCRFAGMIWDAYGSLARGHLL